MAVRDERLQIGKRRNRYDPLDRRRQGHIGATHSRAQVTARGMAGDDDRTRDETRSDLDSARDLLGHRAYPGFGRERVRWNGAGPSARHGACGQMRPQIAIEPQPIAAMDEHQKAKRRGLGQKEIESVARFGTIRDGGPRSLTERGAKSRSLLRPTRRKCFGARNEGAVCIGAVVVHSGVPYWRRSHDAVRLSAILFNRSRRAPISAEEKPVKARSVSARVSGRMRANIRRPLGVSEITRLRRSLSRS